MEFTGKIVGADLKAFSGRQYTGSHRENHRIWILTADKRIARLFARTGDHLELIGEIKPAQDAVTELTNRTVGRNSGPGDPSLRHKYEPHMNESRQESLFFIHELADWLNRIAGEDVFDRLVIAAAPATLGDLRAVLHQGVYDRVAAEVDKELTGFNERELQGELERLDVYGF
jgi:protein required for attachment to host cells